ncbi:dihydroorotase [Eubacterium oxidoreducens]|uniref:Dihydroorotase n=1 Tax=Eubacterium oxidoreducens TaxID=1732 RepID=A0A1G6BCZ9_EUBOX|nr:dihydroorotase [Eubacterium oxidoreducens]SDB18466.1 dihydroorotase [Eubacterium oxidoreducens]
MTLLIKNAIVVDPASKTVVDADVLIDGETIKEISKNITKDAERVIDAKGSYLMPGFIDLHVHLRDPGLEYKETIETGSKAAAAGGYTTILAMPNTKPVADQVDVVKYVNNKAKALSPIRVLQIGAVTKGQKGEKLADIEGMVKEGAPAISEDGKSVMNSGLYYEGMLEAKRMGIPVFAHCEDINLVRGGVVHEGKQSQKLGLAGITGSVEDVIAARDMIMAAEIGVRLHLCHVSTALSVDMLAWAKARGAQVTGEVCPHHFALCEDDIPADDARYKMNPPLRSKEDQKALIKGIADGTIEVIATDHAPHSVDEKNASMKKAPFGIVGLETAAALTYTKLVKENVIDICQMAEKMSLNPAKIIGLDRGSVQEGKIADLVLFNPKENWTVDSNEFYSKGRNTPFDGETLYGRVKATIFNGEVVFEQ